MVSFAPLDFSGDQPLRVDDDHAGIVGVGVRVVRRAMVGEGSRLRERVRVSQRMAQARVKVRTVHAVVSRPGPSDCVPDVDVDRARRELIVIVVVTPYSAYPDGIGVGRPDPRRGPVHRAGDRKS